MGAGPERRRRTCVGCGVRHPPGRLLRFGLAAGRWAIPGAGGRSAYACPEPACLVAGMRRGGFQRAVRGGGPRLEPEEGLRLAAGALVEKAARLLGLGARARAVAVGRQAVAEALARGRARVILVAQDAGRDAAAWAAAARGAAGVPLLVFPSKGRLGRALGRGEAAVAGVCDPALAAGIIGYLHAAGRMAEGASSTEANLGPPAAADGPADGRGGG